ncbi:sensor histidine kinase [Marinisporobacter balticus]|uniref:histidine kinase n=1 Tax=Marinisporobacter balticus TaxID=2018667 RepID=A0A4R2LH60_9FIRM|nr:ATP-binding protein [Marinisporobacter balticus]TCO78665.1 HAMP domain-containing protein [Marinisporobacter balticus]
MRKSIGLKLFMGMTCFVFIIVGLSWILNTKYLENYYLDKKKESLIDYAREIQLMYKDNIENIEDEIAKIENKIGGNILKIILNEEDEYDAFAGNRRGRHGFGGMGKDIPLTKEVLNRVLMGESVLEIFKHPKLKVNFLVYSVPLEDNSILVLQTSIASIQESVKIAKAFYLYIGIISLMIGTVMAFLFSTRFTKPIVALNRVARGMAKLDFSKKYKVQSKDEIGELGETMNYLSDQLDLTIFELNEANKKLREDIARERKIDHMRKEFISSVSHELKTPIALIQGYAEGLYENVAEDEESKNFYCEVIMDEADKMGKLVKDLLALSQMESGNKKLEIENFHINDLVEKVYNKYKPIFQEKNIHDRLEKEDKRLKVNGDPSKIEQVLVNFINNAINHISGERKLKVCIEDRDEKVRIEIYNTGEAIPSAEMERIWDSFYKVDKARSRTYGGTGLGLSIVRGILKLHNSAFGVFNKNEGVVFWFELRKGE